MKVKAMILPSWMMMKLLMKMVIPRTHLLTVTAKKMVKAAKKKMKILSAALDSRKNFQKNLFLKLMKS